MNPYLQHLSRIEFVITHACTGRCKHCSEGGHAAAGGHIDGDAAASVVRDVAKGYPIQSVMTFGGEPLLHVNDVCSIHAAARDAGIAARQLITNGFFSRDEAEIQRVAGALGESGVNSILLSVDAFHQETIPLEPVLAFAKAVQALRVSKLQIHPAWLVSQEADNPYNHKTREILARFNAMGIPTSSGNVIFPSGNALKYLGEYFEGSVLKASPYAEDAHDVKAICVNPQGDVLGGNIYRTGILTILENYKPEGIK